MNSVNLSQQRNTACFSSEKPPNVIPFTVDVTLLCTMATPTAKTTVELRYHTSPYINVNIRKQRQTRTVFFSQMLYNAVLCTLERYRLILG